MSDFSRVDALLEGAVGAVFPAAQLVVLDGLAPRHQRSVGDCSGETLFDLASLTKPLATALLVMQGLERGLLSLDDQPRPGVTVRHLLAHASGLPAWKLLPRDARQAVQEESLEAAPGSRSLYSDLGFLLLGFFVEERAGLPLDAQFAAEIARPLGLEIGFRPADPARCAPTEGELRGVVHDENARALLGVAGHAGLFGTAGDVAAIARALLEAWGGRGGQSIVSPRTVRQFWSGAGIPGSTWCLGWDRPAASGSMVGERWPKDGVGHWAFTGCSLWLDPARGRAVVLLTNRVHPTRSNERIKLFRPELHDAVIEALP